MIKIENVEVMGWEAAIRGMRNPMNSWEKSDSFIPCYIRTKCHKCEVNQKCSYYFESGVPYKKDEFIGPNDLDLMTRLRKAGTDHRKFMRMITVYLDITAPLYWWKEFDTYKVGTVANSCSTMHKIADKEFTLEDFSCEHLKSFYWDLSTNNSVDSCVDASGLHDASALYSPFGVLNLTIKSLNKCRKKYIETNDKRYWWQMIQLLPSSYNQRRTVMLNYEVLANIYKSRYNHKLDEWHDFCSLIEGLDYSELITADVVNKRRTNHE